MHQLLLQDLLARFQKNHRFTISSILVDSRRNSEISRRLAREVLVKYSRPPTTSTRNNTQSRSFVSIFWSRSPPIPCLRFTNTESTVSFKLLLVSWHLKTLFATSIVGLKSSRSLRRSQKLSINKNTWKSLIRSKSSSKLKEQGERLSSKNVKAVGMEAPSRWWFQAQEDTVTPRRARAEKAANLWMTAVLQAISIWTKAWDDYNLGSPLINMTPGI